VEYHPELMDADCPLWMRFLDRVTGGDAALAGYLQRIAGYVLTGDRSEQCIFVLTGFGRNGKSVYLDTLAALLGDYFEAVPAAAFAHRENTGSTATPELASLPGARLAAAVETNAELRLDEGLIKRCTGDTHLPARQLYGRSFSYVPQFRLIFVTNSKPQLRGSDEGIWSRMRLVRFPSYIPAPERDKRLLEKLRAELPAILAWAVRGCLAWQEQGLNEPPAVVAEGSQHRMRTAPVPLFVDECCRHDPRGETPSGLLYEAFEAWAEARDAARVSAEAFGRVLSEMGFQNDRRRVGGEVKRLRLGIRLRPQEELSRLLRPKEEP
jgi:putative DNA primase/helicase